MNLSENKNCPTDGHRKKKTPRKDNRELVTARHVYSHGVLEGQGTEEA